MSVAMWTSSTRDARRDRRDGAGRSGEKDQERPQPLAAGQRVAARAGCDPGIAPDGRLEPHLDASRGTRRALEPAAPSPAQRSFGLTGVERDDPRGERPVAHLTEARVLEHADELVGPGKRRTLAGRYV